VGAGVAVGPTGAVTAETEKGKTVEIALASVRGERSMAGAQLLKRDRFVRVVAPVGTPSQTTTN
jgi:DNA gyrase subunit A